MRQDYHRRRGSFTIIRCLHRRQKCEKDASFRRQFSTTHWPVTTVPPHLYQWIHIFEWLRVASLLFTSLMLGVRALAPMVVVAMKCVWCLVFGVGRVWCLYVCSMVEFWVVFFACIGGSVERWCDPCISLLLRVSIGPFPALEQLPLRWH